MSYHSQNIEMETLAATILAGETMPYGRFGLHTADEWTRAAEYAVDTGDWSELEFMCEGETAYEDRPRESEDDAEYGDYLYEQQRDRKLMEQWEAGL